MARWILLARTRSLTRQPELKGGPIGHRIVVSRQDLYDILRVLILVNHRPILFKKFWEVVVDVTQRHNERPDSCLCRRTLVYSEDVNAVSANGFTIEMSSSCDEAITIDGKLLERVSFAINGEPERIKVESISKGKRYSSQITTDISR